MIKKLLHFAVYIALVFSLSPLMASAAGPQTIPCPENLPCITEKTQESGEAVRAHITQTFGVRFLTLFLAVMGVTAVVFIIVGGIQMLLAGGNEDQIGKAKKTIMWAIIGLIVAILSVAIVQIVTKLPFNPS